MSFPPFPERESSSEYPPAALNGRSPYFIGKPKARRNGHHNSHDDVHMAQSSSGHPNERRPAPNTREQSDNFTGFSLDLSRHDEIVIDEQDSDVEIIPRKKSAISVDSCKGMAFDFSSDPKLNNVRKAVMSIVDPEGKRKGDDRLNAAIACSSSRSMDLVNGKKEKKSKPLERKGLASLNDFRMASGKAIVKEMKQVVPQNENSDESQSDNPFYQSTNFGPKRNAGKRHAPSFNPPPPINSGSSIIKKGLSAMGMTTEGAAKDQVLTGLRAEPSLKHFDENIISLIESEIMSVTTETGWSDVAGLQGAKKALREIVVLPFKRPDVFKGIRAPPKGVLLFGPPGTGKTMIGKCVASQCRATFFNISASSLTSKWVGEGEKLVRALFAVARLKLPSVIFIDEIDSLLSSRSESEHESSRRIKTEFLVQLDGVATNSDERLLVLGATNRPQELDEAARRRFAKRLYIALPQPEARLSIIENLLKDMSNSVRKQDLDRIAELTNGYSGADMRQLCAEASMGPIRDIDNSSTLDIETVEANDIRPITLTDFEEAVRVVRPTVVDQDLVAYEAWDKKFGCLL